eukprot:m.170346 g.170346  ORF g.170346 m.170346 type:complete len:1105 (-) comp16687_c0_seq1:1038-4352(-)
MEPSQHYYAVSAHKASAVTAAVKANFTSPNAINLLIAKNNHLEIYSGAPEGLLPIVDVNLYGSISHLQVLRLPGDDCDSLLMVTDTFKFAILSYDADSETIVTRVKGDALSSVGRPNDTGCRVAVDPNNRCLALHVYPGAILIVPFDEAGNAEEAYTVRCPHVNVLELVFCHECNVPTLALLTEDYDKRQVVTYTVDMTSRELNKGPWVLKQADPFATLLVAVPHTKAGVLVLGEESVHYCDKATESLSTSIPRSLPSAVCFIDPSGTRVLFGDQRGALHMLVLEGHAEGQVRKIVAQQLGQIVTPSSLVYLDEGVVYVGSQRGDPQLIRLLTDANEEGSYVSVLEEYPNIGPIVDFTLVDLDGHGQSQVVACSGVHQDGSLRILRNGIGLDDLATVDMEGIQRVFALSTTANNDSEHSHLALTLPGQTAFLSLAGDQLDAVAIPSVDATAAALLVRNVVHNQWLVITAADVRLINAGDLQCVATWQPTDEQAIGVCTANSTQAIVACGTSIFSLDIAQGSLTMVAEQQLDHEVACLDVTPLRGETQSQVVLVAMWTDLTVRLLETSTLRECHRQAVQGEIVAHSTVLCQLATDLRWALVGMGDGSLNYFTIDNDNQLSEPKQAQLASEPLSLQAFTNQEKPYVFASSERPCVVHSRNDKLLFSNVNLPMSTTVCPLNTAQYPNCLAIATPQTLSFAVLDNVQNLQIRKLPLLESPIAVAHHAHFHTLLVGTIANEASLTAEAPIGYLRLYSDRAMELLDSYKLAQTESANRIVSMSLHDGTHCFVVGTAYVEPEEDYPSKGRVLLFTVVENKLTLAYEHQVEGSAMAIHVFREGLLVGINSKLVYLTWHPDDEEKLKSVASFTGNLMILELDVRGDFVLVGDLMQSLAVVVWQTETGRFEESASDDTPCYLMASAMVNQDAFLLVDSLYNLSLLQRNETAGNDDELQRLGVAGRFHLGDAINRFARGTLAMQLASAGMDVSEDNASDSFVYGTLLGAVGMLIPIPKARQELFVELQKRLASVLKGVGELVFEDYRSLKDTYYTSIAPAVGFVDGDLIEKLLDLPDDVLDKVVLNFQLPDEDGHLKQITKQEILSAVEDMVRLH